MSSVFNFHDNSGADTMPPNHHYSSHHDASSDDGDFFDENPVWEAIFCYGWLFVLFYCLLCRNKREPPSTEVGDRIRARAREAQERIQQKKVKEGQSPEERKRIVDENMITKVVLSKDAQGNLTLGDRHQISGEGDDTQEASDDDDVEAQKVDDTDDNDNSKNITHLEADDDEEEGLTCVICLDCFEPGDLVSWTKHDPTCTHIFHDECIRQWLEERRQDECPSCRCHLVPPVEIPKTKSIEDDDEEGEESGDTDEEEVADSETDSSTDDSSSPQQQQQPKEEGESSLFAMMSGLLSRAAGSLPSPSAPEYNLVSVNSGSFDSQDAPEQVQDPEDPPQQQQPLDAESPSSSSEQDEDEDGESNQQQWISSNNNNESSSTANAPDVATMSISEALRQSEEDDDEDGNGEERDGAAMELGMQHAVTDIAFSP
eukprot:CAMPEP_0113637210 /NCGR_PEP_ID=MMETSP0017_2-20120614/19470_1 /TAXON_ID=2856 /ORGANISM="Cylindrotheca closterium" /LENGTH=429 /DNA_ID=CAMNT_0000548213 /DNA_START=250 /DNA_END=1539 /DNA_ORIENTATION=+ /assembly_acc=CAM_ASM_000147